MTRPKVQNTVVIEVPEPGFRYSGPMVPYALTPHGPRVDECMTPAIAQHLHAIGARFRNRQNDTRTRDEYAAEVQAFLRLLEDGRALPPSYFDFFVATPFDDPRVMQVHLCQNFARYPMSEEEFEVAFGYKPANDDLHRVNCDQAGKVGHWQCGFCPVHNRARFMCGCIGRS